jgi:hypothetical protein
VRAAAGVGLTTTGLGMGSSTPSLVRRPVKRETARTPARTPARRSAKKEVKEEEKEETRYASSIQRGS